MFVPIHLLAALWCFSELVIAEEWRSASHPPSNERHNACSDSHYQFERKIERVAVIGAGPSGLQRAAALIEHGFQVRLFERAPKPGGQWFYTDEIPVSAPFPNRPIEVAGYVPNIPSTLPCTRYYGEGEGGLTVDWRVREHWNPSSVWASMKTTAPPFEMSMPNVEHHPDTPWRAHNPAIQRHVRQYASSVGLNSNDEESANITSYSTRVERVQKLPGQHRWTLTLRKLVEHDRARGRVQFDWWTEEFDAVIVASISESDSPWVPPIPGLKRWAEVIPQAIYHVREYRRPERLAGKNVLIIGGSLSGLGVAQDLISHAASVTLSIRNHPLDDPIRTLLFKMIPKNATVVPEITSFKPLNGAQPQSAHSASLLLNNGSTISGYDHIILATGYRTSFPFLVDFHNSTIVGDEEPETRIAPIITDGTHVRSLHWTGHYIPDPTLALTSVEPWTIGPFQALGIAKTWSGKACLPSISEMWKAYPGPRGDEYFPYYPEKYNRLFTQWLNDASLQFGGRFVAPLERNTIGMDYFVWGTYGVDFEVEKITRQMRDSPRSSWPTRGETEGLSLLARGGGNRKSGQHWAELSLAW